MFEFIKHSLGLCGEGHASLLTCSPLIIGGIGYFAYIKSKLKSKLKLWKKN
jgi:hypothetical protein